jgi:hypothetical protein
MAARLVTKRSLHSADKISKDSLTCSIVSETFDTSWWNIV